MFVYVNAKISKYSDKMLTFMDQNTAKSGSRCDEKFLELPNSNENKKPNIIELND